MNRDRQRAFADWFLEISALVAVFPALDVALQRDFHLTWLAVTGAVLALILLLFGVYLIPPKEEP